MESYFNILPEELYLVIFKYLQDKDIISCLLVCKRWNRISQDKTIYLSYISQELKEGTDLSHIFLSCCLKGYEKSVDTIVNLLLKNVPSMGFHCLWNRGFLSAAKGGHLNIMQKMLTYGATDVFAEEALSYVKDNQQAVQLILDNFDLSENTIFKILQT